MRFILITATLCLTSSLFAQNILFVGNSLTYSNDLPSLVETIGKVYSKRLSTECICFPNYGLEDHWNDGAIQEKIKAKKFDYVIFQQGPSSQAYGRSSLFEFGSKISVLTKANGAQPAYLTVWPSVQHYHTFEGVIKNHKDAAEANDAMLIPAGKMWVEYRKMDYQSDLYTTDLFHPSPTGSFLAALTIIKTVFPEIALTNLKHNKFRTWVSSKKDFERILFLVNQGFTD